MLFLFISLILYSVSVMPKSNYLLVEVSNETSSSQNNDTEAGDYWGALEWSSSEQTRNTDGGCKDGKGNIRQKDEQWSEPGSCNTCGCRCYKQKAVCYACTLMGCYYD